MRIYNIFLKFLNFLWSSVMNRLICRESVVMCHGFMGSIVWSGVLKRDPKINIQFGLMSINTG